MAAPPSRLPRPRPLLALALLTATCAVRSAVADGLRDFDPAAVAALDAAMWESYYARQRLRLFCQLAALARSQGDCSRLASYRLAYRAARAAFVFKRGKDRADYAQALPTLEKLFRALGRVHHLSFDPKRAAALELEWWIIHRERASRQPGELEAALAAAAAEVYGITAEQAMGYAGKRAEAMAWRDTKAAAGPLTAADWTAVRERLQESWQSLWNALHPAASPDPAP